jgi:hypothetical protein
MISKLEKNRIIRLKRQANYLRWRADNEDLTNKQRTQALGTANALSWGIGMIINALETREKEFVRDRQIDRIMKWLRFRKFSRNKRRYEMIEEMVRDLYIADIMDHERTFDGLATQLEKKEAEEGNAHRTEA